MITAYMLFVRGDVQPARYWVAAELPKEIEVELIRSRRAGVWNLPHGIMVAPKYVPLIHGVGLVVSNATKPSYAISLKDMQTPKDRIYVSDTGELIWDCREADRCIFVVNTSKSKVISGFVSGKRIDLGDIVIDVEDTLLNGWTTIAVHVIEGENFKNARKVLVITVGATFNTDMPIYEYTQRRLLFQANTDLTYLPDIHGLRITTFGNWGKTPTIVEGVNAIVKIKTEKDIVAYSLDNTGLPTERIYVKRVGEYEIISVSGSTYKTIWYELSFT